MTGYNFSGWYDNDVLVSVENPYSFSMPNENETLIAKFEQFYKIIDSTHLEMGQYPQSKVTDNSVISDLNVLAGTLPTSINSYNWTAYDWYIDSSNTNKFGWYIDVDINEYTYRGVYFTSLRPRSVSSSSSASTSYQDDNGYSASTVYWFKFEPILWRILQDSTDYFVLSDKILDSNQYYHFGVIDAKRTRTDYQGNSSSGIYDNNYKYSDLRKFLNVDFYESSFTSTQKKAIKTTTVNNASVTTGHPSNSYACENTNDKVFALSYSEVTNSSYGLDSDSKRILSSTDYAKCVGVYNYDTYDSGYWWLRSPDSSDSIYGCRVYRQGDASSSSSVLSVSSGIVPALRFNKTINF